VIVVQRQMSNLSAISLENKSHMMSTR